MGGTVCTLLVSTVKGDWWEVFVASFIEADFSIMLFEVCMSQIVILKG